MERERPSRRGTIGAASGRGELRLTGEELAAAAGISHERLMRLVHVGLIEPAVPGGEVFTAATAERLKRMLRLRSDLGVSLFGVAIIVDLVEQLEDLQAELERLRGGR